MVTKKKNTRYYGCLGSVTFRIREQHIPSQPLTLIIQSVNKKYFLHKFRMRNCFFNFKKINFSRSHKKT